MVWKWKCSWIFIKQVCFYFNCMHNTYDFFFFSMPLIFISFYETNKPVLPPLFTLCALGVVQCHKATIGLVHKSPLWRVRDALPYGDGLGVTRIHCSHVLVVPPVSKREKTVKVSSRHSGICTDRAHSCTRPVVMACWFGLILSKEEITHSCRYTQIRPGKSRISTMGV